MPEHYGIYKKVVCSLFGQQCGDDVPMVDTATPKCRDCKIYQEWKASGLSVEEYAEKYT